MIVGNYPELRLRRLRRNHHIRELVAEHTLTVKDMVYPIFVTEGEARKNIIKSMPDQYQVSIDLLPPIIEKCVAHGIYAIALFPFVEANKDLGGAESYNEEGIIPRAIKLVKQEFPEVVIFSDIALDPYTLHGHDGIIDNNGYMLNDETIEVLVKQAMCHAYAGVDFVCPSDMTDGRIGKIRRALDGSGFTNVGIVSHAAKYASKLFAPFRDAVGSRTAFQNADKKTYQMNPANSNEALRRVAQDVVEGADIIMIKPGLAYLDVVQKVKETFKMPTAIYHVSGEYAMLKAASHNGWLDFEQVLLEQLLCAKRAGCDLIWTYGALEAAQILK